MPITKEKWLLYPPNWKELRAAVQARAENRCETCGVPNHSVGFRDNAGQFHDIEEDVNEQLCDPDAKLITIVCTTAHIYEDDEGTTDIGRLVLECQKCHLHRDAANHRRKALETRAKKRGLVSLFGSFPGE